MAYRGNITGKFSEIPTSFLGSGGEEDELEGQSFKLSRKEKKKFFKAEHALHKDYKVLDSEAVNRMSDKDKKLYYKTRGNRHDKLTKGGTKADNMAGHRWTEFKKKITPGFLKPKGEDPKCNKHSCPAYGT